MKLLSLKQELENNAYPGRGIVIGKTKDGSKAAIAYFIMGRSVNSRNRVFVPEGDAMRTKAFDESKLSDPSLIIYNPYLALDNADIITNGDLMSWYLHNSHRKNLERPSIAPVMFGKPVETWK